MFVIYSVLILCQIQKIQSLFLSVGDYSKESIPDLNTLECGLSDVPIVHEFSFNDNKCFQNKYQNKTFIEIPKRPGNGAKQPKSRIHNGKEIRDITEAPWVVYLRPENLLGKGVCTGVLITFEWILTAAHCYEGWEVEWLPDFVGWSTLSVTVGSPRQVYSLNIRDKLFKQKVKFISHPLYKEPLLLNSSEPLNNTEGIRVKQLNDIALVKVPNIRKEISKYDDRYLVNTICLPQRDEVNRKEEQAQFYGYGVVNDNKFWGKMPDFLQTGWITLNPFKLCAAAQRYCHKPRCGTLCGHADINSAKPCSGDSGGPLVQFKGHENRAILAGTLRGQSFTKPSCVSAKHLYWITTSHHIDWILETMKKYG